ncbi:large exoprotein involved in heme utilization or adhesion [Methylobacterium sp. Leaf469]|jgi:hypothetical protein|uniref:hypothetical protein n=1 Tax=unclassified Methylobacterium TaxID=2615210 RepID=UPI0006FF11E1|nr:MULTISPECIES: hypothetical protein [unclassified Methylobacterium]USU33309.1 hypothetical protein NG677_06470 [Methylobacterium sp. OTU13CASTA1]KQP34190.1 large exoprotein involved in heme utilization or adhesion [Methylobacterium sp. Leaf102]KQP36583.1 large exoprotein involved in heme utilization or adhesion [Methylobacterium sp. Leaf100]KQP62086.1 large exoprotein involved in heme utilization or adhesion [Methylobacterium sp. Leaf112]KQU05310.1 large exoprotein involved in heme utilizati
MRLQLLTAALLVLTGPATAATKKVQVPHRYDGAWSIEVVTLDGPCDRAYRYGVQIRRGEATYAGGEFSINGRVSGNGSVRAVISRGSDKADVVGRLGRQGTGGGTWNTTGLIGCSGRWNAERRS